MPWRKQTNGDDRRQQDRADDANRRRASDERQDKHQREVAEFRRELDSYRELLRNAQH